MMPGGMMVGGPQLRAALTFNANFPLCLTSPDNACVPWFQQQPQIILLREGTDTSQGKAQLISNINACMAVVDTVRTTLGPRGMDKLVHDDKVGSWRRMSRTKRFTPWSALRCSEGSLVRAACCACCSSQVLDKPPARAGAGDNIQ